MIRSLLRDDDLTAAEQAHVLARAAAFQRDPHHARPLAGPKAVAMIFDKQTLRTQVSFSAGIAELGGAAVMVDGALARIGERESIADVGRVLGRQVEAIVWRTYEQRRLEEMAHWSGVPVVNALTDEFHPCQLLADLLTVREEFGELAGRKVAFLGDGACNMGHSWLLAGALAGMDVRIAAPAAFAPAPEILERAAAIAAGTGGAVAHLEDPVAALEGVDVATTDTWVSMGKEDEAAERARIFGPYALDEAALAHAADHAIVLHCLPAYRGKEISAAVLDGPRSRVWDQAENRRHVQKAVLEFCVAGGLPVEAV
ncbi:ornithine carbamoyltransferase [Nocardioides limicola]|uniref:ornithine carbamoyltransferase n=1 Tax=Nocardioides limicola TaxID=2803368 RepID=UPI00193BC96E|nr:ornithine carbamoyltransferase [Nocardioides sp. DJM-14]